MTTNTTTATIPTATAKKFAGDIGAIVRRFVPITHGDDDLFKPSHVRMTDITARRAMGATLTTAEQAHSFVHGLVHLTVRLAWGSIQLAQALEGQTQYGAHAVRTAHAALLGTKGVTAGALRQVVTDAVTSMLALPAPTKKLAAPSVETKTPAPTETPAPTADDVGVIRVMQQSFATVAANEAAHDALWAGYGDALALAMRQAQATVQALTVRHATTADAIRADVEALNNNAALDLIRALAEARGFRLTKITTKRAA